MTHNPKIEARVTDFANGGDDCLISYVTTYEHGTRITLRTDDDYIELPLKGFAEAVRWLKSALEDAGVNV